MSFFLCVLCLPPGDRLPGSHGICHFPRGIVSREPPIWLDLPVQYRVLPRGGVPKLPHFYAMSIPLRLLVREIGKGQS
jgi:hypothetical protein